MSSQAIGFIGTGVMGAAMASHLNTAGHQLFVHNRTRAKARDLEAAGATWCDSAGEVASRTAVVFTIVGMPSDVEAVYLGSHGVLEQANPGTLLIDMTTSSPALAKQIAEQAQTRDLAALDAPVSGGDIGAKNASLSIMVGGDTTAFERALPLLRQLGKTIVHQGPAGAGQYTKLCNQVAIAATMMSVCESMALARAAGLNPERVLDSITSGAAGSWSLSHLMPRALREDWAPGFAVRHFIKDLDIALQCADEFALSLPGLQLARSLYQKLVDTGLDELGTQALLRLYQPTGN